MIEHVAVNSPDVVGHGTVIQIEKWRFLNILVIDK